MGVQGHQCKRDCSRVSGLAELRRRTDLNHLHRYVVTDMNVDTRSGDPAYLQSLNDRIPAGRWGTPEDFKGSAVFLASDASNYIHGHILLVSTCKVNC